MFVEDRVIDIVPGFSPENWSSDKCIVDLEAYAIEFDKEHSYKLAGPYIHEDKHYALAVVTLHDEQRTLEEILKDTKEKFYSRPYSLSFIPYLARERLFKAMVLNDYSMLYQDPVTGFYFSDLDLKYGRNELDPEVVDRAALLSSDRPHRPFWVTTGASLKITDALTFSEASEMYANMANVYEMVRSEMTVTTPSVGRPWRIYLCGNDDSSWTKAYATKKDVDEAIASIRKDGFGYVATYMKPTN